MSTTDTFHPNGMSGAENHDEKKDKETIHYHSKLEYSINEIPPIHITLLYGLQQLMANMSGPLSTVYFIHLELCTKGKAEANLFFAQLLSTSVFMVGIASFIQCTFGIRLPVVQGSSATFIAPVIAMMTTEQWRCPSMPEIDISGNFTNLTTNGVEIDDEPWKPRLREISGCLMAASLLQIVLGCTGIMGFLMNYIGPLTICPTISLIGLSLFETATAGSQHQWGIALLTVALVLIFSMVLDKKRVPLPTWTRGSGFSMQRFRLFRLFPHLFAIMISWLLCYILTITNMFPEEEDKLGYFARTDARVNVLYEMQWFYFPYPFQWGTPTISVGLLIGMIGATLASIVESVGDYYATAKASQVNLPPKHAVNRGIAMEGFASVISGLIGAAHATTTYSGTVGFIQITGVASRFVWQIMSVMFLICGVFGKLGAALTIIPDPIIGALMLLSLGMVIPVGLCTLQYMNMNSSRNHIILAISLMLGLMFPFWIKNNPGVIDTGSQSADQLLEVLLSTGMLIGGAVGFILDNTIPGTKAERGLIGFNDKDSEKILSNHDPTYDIPLISNWLRKIKCCAYVPFLPSYVPYECGSKCCNKNNNPESTHDNELRKGEVNAAYDSDVTNTPL